MEDYNNEQWWIELQEAMKGFDENSMSIMSDGKLNQINAASEWCKNNLTGYKHSDFTKSKLSNAKIGTKRNIESIKKSNKGISKTKWEQTLCRLSKEDILNAQLKNGNHQKNTMKELNISFNPYKKLCKHYSIELKKTTYEKSEWVRENQSKKLLVYSENNELLKEYYSVNNACKELKLHKGNMLINMKKGKLYKGYYFKYKDTI